MGESDMESEEKEKNKPQTGNVHKYFFYSWHCTSVMQASKSKWYYRSNFAETEWKFQIVIFNIENVTIKISDKKMKT